MIWGMESVSVEKERKTRRKGLKMLSSTAIWDYTCALFHRDIFRLGKPLQEGQHPPPWA